jgi:hypothetical protein
MKNASYLPVFSLCLFMFFNWNCKKSGTTEMTENAPVDTRQLVRDAYARINPMELQPTFNAQRVILIKKQLDAETDPTKKLNIQLEYAFELLKAGQSLESLREYESAFEWIVNHKIPLDAKAKRNLYFIVGMAYMRHGEIENCVQNHNHESCFIPIKGGGVHQLQNGSRKAVKQFEAVLKEFPEDLEAKYLLNIAYMTLGEYPDKVPPQWLIDPKWYTNKVNIQPFKDIAADLGLNRKGHAGGIVFDDFTNDGWLDFVMTSWGPEDPTLFYVNNGDGTFSDRSKESGLYDHVGSLHLNQTDYNNDGWLDLFLMRGAWYMKNGDVPRTLLKNNGDGTFTDVTLQAGLTDVGGTQASAWADFNLDGWLDLVVANESMQDYQRGIDLYINQKNGTFTHESEAWGLTQNEFFKGCVATYANDDRYPDIYFTSLTNGNMLMINQAGSGQNRFLPAGSGANVRAPQASFPCWTFDYNNDGHEDLFASAFSNDKSPSVMWMNDHMGKSDEAYLPKLYMNKGNMQYEDVSLPAGLHEVAYTMGCNFGDINTDGFLDFYLATGNPLYQSLVPNKMYLNMDGRRFEDVSYIGGFGNIQKGHGVGFGDWDHDGDEDVFVVIGGAYDGDFFYSCLFDNPNENKNNWVVLKLEGATVNKAAIGALVEISVQENGKERKIFRKVTSGASFGANSLVLEVGLRKATSINSVTVQWPCKDCPEQTFKGMDVNKAYVLTEGIDAAKAIPYQAVKPKAGKTIGHQEHH